MTLEERFLSHVKKTDAGCWEWTGACMYKGYGILSNTGLSTRLYNTQYAHRVAYWLWKGEIHEGLEIDHLCRNRKCVNPDHLEVVTRRENQRRGLSASGRNFRKTQCPQGHPYDLLNTYWKPEGERICRTCHREQEARRKQTKRHGDDPLLPIL